MAGAVCSLTLLMAGSEAVRVSAQVLDAVVQNVYAKARVEPPIGVFGLAQACGLQLTAMPGRTEGLIESEIRYDSRLPYEMKRALVARCIAQWAIAWNDVPDDAAAVAYVARALSTPR